jgi:hypothetical protein
MRPNAIHHRFSYLAKVLQLSPAIIPGAVAFQLGAPLGRRLRSPSREVRMLKCLSLKAPDVPSAALLPGILALSRIDQSLFPLSCLLCDARCDTTTPSQGNLMLQDAHLLLGGSRLVFRATNRFSRLNVRHALPHLKHRDRPGRASFAPGVSGGGGAGHSSARRNGSTRSWHSVPTPGIRTPSHCCHSIPITNSTGVDFIVRMRSHDRLRSIPVFVWGLISRRTKLISSTPPQFVSCPDTSTPYTWTRCNGSVAIGSCIESDLPSNQPADGITSAVLHKGEKAVRNVQLGALFVWAAYVSTALWFCALLQISTSYGAADLVPLPVYAALASGGFSLMWRLAGNRTQAQH